MNNNETRCSSSSSSPPTSAAIFHRAKHCRFLHVQPSRLEAIETLTLRTTGRGKSPHQRNKTPSLFASLTADRTEHPPLFREVAKEPPHERVEGVPSADEMRKTRNRGDRTLEKIKQNAPLHQSGLGRLPVVIQDQFIIVSSLADVPDVDDLPRRVVGQAPHPEEPLGSQLVHRSQGFLDGRVVVGGMQVKQVHRRQPGKMGTQERLQISARIGPSVGVEWARSSPT